MTQFSRAAAGWPLLLLPLLLAACNTVGSEYPPPSTAAAAPATAPEPAPGEAAAAKPKPTRNARARNAQPADDQTEAEENKGPMTHARASAECWMAAEKGHPSLEVREKMVDKCIDQKMNAAAKSQTQTQ